MEEVGQSSLVSLLKSAGFFFSAAFFLDFKSIEELSSSSLSDFTEDRLERLLLDSYSFLVSFKTFLFLLPLDMAPTIVDRTC